MNAKTSLSTIRPGEFRRSLANEFNEYLEQESRRYAPADRLRIDLHCHDHNSDKPY